MSRRLSRFSPVLVIILSSEAWALGLGDIRLESALNEPLRAEIQLLSATPDELDNLTVALASGDTFARYGLDRPVYLQNIQFEVVRSGRADGNVVLLRSTSPMAEPFLTFLVEATWSRGRLLREYTVLLDPPTFAPPVTDSAPAVQAPSRSTPADSGQIQRPAPQPRPQQQRPAPAPAPIRPAGTERAAPPAQPAEEVPFDFSTTAGGDVYVERGDTLWGVASRVRPDSRLTMNQTMLAIFEANPDAFGGNINILRAGASLRIPSADEIFQISRSDALAEAQRHHAEWSGGVAPAPVADTRPSLTLVPPDDDYAPDTTAPLDTGYDAEPYGAEPTAREQEIEQRIAELEAADVPQQQSLIEIRDNELAALREELARIRGEIYEPPAEDLMVDDAGAEDIDPFAEPVDDMADDAAVTDDMAADDAAIADTTPAPSTIIRTPAQEEPGLLDQVMSILTEWWMIIVGVIVVVGGALFWFMRRGGGDEDVDAWQPMGADSVDDDLSSTESLRAPVTEESIVVVEQPSSVFEETVDTPAMEETIEAEPPPAAREGEAVEFDSLEDTFSSETAINLDQTDPIAEADFHMAYGLYDQAADLINGALDVEPARHDLLTKLCEIYFVWGNRDAFIDAAGKLKAAVGDTESSDWDKIVIMGQQIAADDELFSGASAAGATKAVDLSFEADMHETGALDMELIADADEASDIVDLGGIDSEETAPVQAAEDGGDGVDFFIEATGESETFADEDTDMLPAEAETEMASLDLDATAESPTVESAPDFDVTKEMPAVDKTEEMPTAEVTVETPTIEEQFAGLDGTGELPSLDETIGDAIAESGQAAEETAEINLEDLGLDVDSLAETELASLDELDVTGEVEALEDEDTGILEALADTGSVTGRNPEVDPDATGVQTILSADDTGIRQTLEDTLTEPVDDSLLDATGMTQVLSADHAVDTTTDAGAELGSDDVTMLASLDDDATGAPIDDEQETMLASLDDDDDAGDFDFAKTEALPKEAFTGEHALDETGELPAVASTDVDLDLDDLTAALRVSEEAGDTIEQPRDDATVEQPRPAMEPDDSPTQALSPDDMSDDLHDARTMTEVGTKLDLARAYVDMGDPAGARSILEEVLDEGDEGQRQQAQQLLDSLPS